MEYKDLLNLFCIQHTQTLSETVFMMLLWFTSIFIIISLVLSVMTFIGVMIINWIVRKNNIDKT
jgi:hypothetical protein